MGLRRSGPPSGKRADPMGKGREGVNPSPGEGDLRGLVDLPQVLHARWPEASADFRGGAPRIKRSGIGLRVD